MDKKIDTLYDLCEMTFKELESTKRELEIKISRKHKGRDWD